MINFLILASASSWITTVLVLKDGPFKSIKKVRDTMKKLLKDNSPLSCFICTSFYVGILVILFHRYVPDIIYVFGVIGLSSTLRGLSNEF